MGRLPMVLVLFALGPCSFAEVAAARGAVDVRVISDDPDAPAGCRSRPAGLTIGRIFRSAGRGDMRGVLGRLGPSEAFQWYSQTTVDGEERLEHVVRRKRRPAARLMVDRARDAGERIRVVALETAYESRRNILHFGQLFRYRTRDAADGRWRRGHGKGAIDCASGGLIVWSAVAEVGERAQGGQHRFCRRQPTALLRRSDITVCSR